MSSGPSFVSSSGEYDKEIDVTRMFGCIEVKVVEGRLGELKEHVIIVLPSPTKEMRRISAASLEQQRNTTSLMEEEEEDDDFEEESLQAVENTLLDELTATLDSWLGCRDGGVSGMAPLKSALRKNNTNKPAPNKIDRNVSFDRLEIREFNMTLGNHPSATSGPPVMLDWDSQPQERVVNLDLYEQARQPRRNRRELKLSFEDRRGILEKDRGFSVAEVKEAWTEALKIRKQRQETREQGQTSMLMDEFWESAVRKYNRTFEYIGF